jgi:hypothetical protein
MTTRSSGKDRTPARRAVPALLAAGLLLLIASLVLAIGRLDHQPHSQTLNGDGPASVAIPAIGVHAPIVAVGLQADGTMQVPDPGQVGWYRLGPQPGAPGPAVLIGHVDDRTGPAVFYRLRQSAPATRSSSASPTGPPAGSSSAAWSSTQRPPCPPTASGPPRPGRCCASSPAAAPSSAPPATTATTSLSTPPQPAPNQSAGAPAYRSVATMPIAAAR